MKKAIVTGSTGFIGSAFVQALTDHGIEVLALGRKDFSQIDPHRKKLLKNAKYLNLDMALIGGLEGQIDLINWKIGNDCVFFNLAWGGENQKLSDMNAVAQFNNVIWTEAAITTANKLGCKRFIQVGSMEEEFVKKYLILDFRIDSFWNRHVVYALGKVFAKNMLILRAHELALDIIYVNHSHVMGYGDDKDSFLQVAIEKIAMGESLSVSSGEQYFDVISLEDCIRGYLLICEKGLSGNEYWVGSGSPQRLKEYLIRMKELLRSESLLEFGKMQYNDVMLEPEIFSIELLTKHTGFKPLYSYEDSVINVLEWINYKAKLSNN
jgi:nucleoside-diphosphate-sugar epimerase